MHLVNLVFTYSLQVHCQCLNCDRRDKHECQIFEINLLTSDPIIEKLIHNEPMSKNNNIKEKNEMPNLAF